MEKLFNSLNLAYMHNLYEIKIVFKKKYLYVLEKLLNLNCIDSYTINKDCIFVKLRYFQNKPLFFFNLRSKRGNKIYKKYSDILKMQNNYSVSLFFTNKSLLTLEEAVFKKTGGEHIADIFFLNKK